MYSTRPRPILKRHDSSSSSSSSSSPPNNTSHINNTAANTISNSHYQHYATSRSYTQNHHNYAPHHGLPNPPTPPMPITPGTISSTRTSSSHTTRSCTVHFPPSPALTSTFACHSSTVYDRSPIVVVPNTCALPERGCPGRTYALGDGGEEEEADEYDNCVSTSPRKEKRKTKTVRDRDFHPRALAFAASSSSPPSSPSFGPCGGVPAGAYSSGFALPPPAVSAASSAAYTSVSLSAAYYNYNHNYEHAPVPALVHDLSSESDESDGVSSLPAQITGYMSAMSLNMSVSASPTKVGSPNRIQMTLDVEEESRDPRESRERKEKAHRRHWSRERVSRHERSSDPDRIPGLASAVPTPMSPVPFSSSSSLASPAFPYYSSASSPFTSASPPSPASFGVAGSPTSYCSSSPRKKGVRRSYPTGSASLGLGCGGFGAQEEGCLGGF